MLELIKQNNLCIIERKIKQQKKRTHPIGCVLFGSPSWTRTNDNSVNSRVLSAAY